MWRESSLGKGNGLCKDGYEFVFKESKEVAVYERE